jgi:hypothetical protein
MVPPAPNGDGDVAERGGCGIDTRIVPAAFLRDAYGGGLGGQQPFRERLRQLVFCGAGFVGSGEDLRHYVRALQTDGEGLALALMPRCRVERGVRFDHGRRGEVQVARAVGALGLDRLYQPRGFPDRAPVNSVLRGDHHAAVDGGGGQHVDGDVHGDVIVFGVGQDRAHVG